MVNIHRYILLMLSSEISAPHGECVGSMRRAGHGNRSPRSFISFGRTQRTRARTRADLRQDMIFFSKYIFTINSADDIYIYDDI